MASTATLSSSYAEDVEDQLSWKSSGKDGATATSAASSGAGAGAFTPADVRLPPEGKFVPVPRSVHEYALKMECPVYQINAQRFFGPPISVAQDWSPEKGSEVFLGRLPRDILEPELIPWLEQIGPVFQVRLMMDFSGTNKGYCFAKYFTKEQAQLAINALNKQDLKGSKVVVARSVDNKKLILSGIATDKSADDVRQVVETMSDGVTHVKINWQVDPDGKSGPSQKGVAFVTYKCHRDAAIARKKMLQKPMFMWHQRVFADWAETFADFDRRPMHNRKLMNKNNVLVVHGLAKETRLQSMWQTFKTLGPFCGVEYIQMGRQQAFVYFKRRAQAEVAKGAFDGAKIEGSRVRVGWCDPEKVPKKRAARKPRAKTPGPPLALPLASPSSSPQQQQLCMDPTHLWNGGMGYQQQQQIWYPQQVQQVPQMSIMAAATATSGPMSSVSSGGPPSSSQDWTSAVAIVPAANGGGGGYGQMMYPAYPYQWPGQEGPSGATVYYYPVGAVCEYGCCQGYQAWWGAGAGAAMGEGGGASAAAYPSAYPPVYWTNFTFEDYYRQSGGTVASADNPDDKAQDNKGAEQDKEGEEEGAGGEGGGEQGANAGAEDKGRLNLYDRSAWFC